MDDSYTIQCWGNDSFGETLPPPDTFTQVTAGWSHTCGIQTDGSAACWGQNLEGQCNAP